MNEKKNIFNKILNKITNLKMEKKKIVLLFGCVMFIVIVFVIGNLNSFNGINDAKKIRREYSKLNDEIAENGKKYPTVTVSKDNNFEYTDVSDILKIFTENGDAVVYFGYPSCVYCRSAIQVLHDTAKETKLEKIYYLDVEKKDSKYELLKSMLDPKFIDNASDNIYAPLVLFIVDGKVVSHNKGTLFSQTHPFEELDTSQKRGLSKIYKYGIEDVLKG